MKKLTSIILALLILPAFSQAMREVEGIAVPETFEELIDPKYSAVIVIDMQNDWVSTQGQAHRETDEPDPDKHAIVQPYAEHVKRIRKFLKAARGAGVQISYAEIIHKDKRGKSVQTGFDFYLKPNQKVAAVEGTWGARTVKELAPQKGDFVIRKIRGNAFYKTYLEDYLKDRSIRTVLITGSATGGCVMATVFGAFERGFYPVLVRDCIDQPGTPMYEWLETNMPMYTMDEITKTWDAMKAETHKETTKKEGDEN